MGTMKQEIRNCERKEDAWSGLEKLGAPSGHTHEDSSSSSTRTGELYEQSDVPPEEAENLTAWSVSNKTQLNHFIEGRRNICRRQQSLETQIRELQISCSFINRDLQLVFVVSRAYISKLGHSIYLSINRTSDRLESQSVNSIRGWNESRDKHFVSYSW